MEKPGQSNSQSGQDIWVIELFGGKRKGFFLEIGAGDGLWISNTLLLERNFGWTGILIEPSVVYERLVQNRPNAICDDSCIAGEEKEVTLFEIFDRGQATLDDRARNNTLLSAVRDDLELSEGDKANSHWGVFQRAIRKKAYPLDAILDRHNAPKVIDYFSLDVEGYEYEILRNFPFDRYAFRCLGVERPTDELNQLLERSGYGFRTRLGQDVMYVNEAVF